MDGSIFLHAPSTLLDATGAGDQWIVDHLLSDYFLFDSPCVGDREGCYAGTGRWVLDTASLPAPELATWALYAVALLGMVAAVGAAGWGDGHRAPVAVGGRLTIARVTA